MQTQKEKGAFMHTQKEKGAPMHTQKEKGAPMHTPENRDLKYAAGGSVLFFLEKVRKRGSMPGLERISALLSLLGDPQKDLKYVHVAGTNGKGSVCAFLASILASSGLVCGVFSSPWIQRYTEQIRIVSPGGIGEISPEDLALVTDEIRRACLPLEKEGPGLPTEFELLTAAALLYFRRRKCDIVILEAGMGGRLDSTNVIPCPEAALLTPVSMDHEAFLGSSPALIAGEKAGIIKEGGRVVSAPQREEVLSVIRNKCREAGASLSLAPRPHILSSGPSGTVFTLEKEEGQEEAGTGGFCLPSPLKIRLAGAFQPFNAALAAQAALVLARRGWPVTASSIRKGLAGALWPGRFEILSEDPLLIIDGAHNPDGIRALTESLSLLLPGKKLTMIAGVLADKDYRAMFREMLPFAESFVTLTVENPRALAAEDLAEYIRECGGRAHAVSSPEEALEEALARHRKDRTAGILSFGSLYYIGRIRTLAAEKGYGPEEK